MKFWRVGESKRKYEFPHRTCLGCAYFQPGSYYSRGATSSGSAASSSPPTLMCMQSAYRGCPSADAQDYSEERARKRRAEGWRCA